MFSAFLPVFLTMFIVIDPVGLVPLYIGLTSQIPRIQRRKIIRKAVFISFGVLAVFILLGKWLLTLLGVDPGAFYIAGGIMLFLVSLDMLFGRPSKSRVSERESGAENADEGVSIAVFPLAIPMLAGPGSITTIILYTSGTEGVSAPPLLILAMLFISLIVILGIVWLFLMASDYIHHFLGETGISVLERIMGLLLSGMSVQFVYDGIVKLGFLKGIAG
jgi:multiple antibiotic resistance protein